jgi:hypothetical protein
MLSKVKWHVLIVRGISGIVNHTMGRVVMQLGLSTSMGYRFSSHDLWNISRLMSGYTL